MKYLELIIHTNREGLEPVQAALMEMGLTDMVVNDPMDLQDLMNKKHDYDWDYIGDEVLKMADEEPTVTLYFDGEETGNGYHMAQEVDLAIDSLRQAMMNGEYGEGADFGPLTITTTLHDDSEWKDNWKEFFKPAKVSEKIMVCPTWEEYELSDEEKEAGVRILKIDPGMAFGTGTHETTSLCLKAMEKYMKPGDCVLDVGCGSGILSIAADHRFVLPSFEDSAGDRAVEGILLPFPGVDGAHLADIGVEADVGDVDRIDRAFFRALDQADVDLMLLAMDDGIDILEGFQTAVIFDEIVSGS